MAVATDYTFTLVVSDPSSAASAPSAVTITVTNVNRAPVANAGAPQTVRSGQVVALEGSVNDPDSDTTFAWNWTAPSGIPTAARSRISGHRPLAHR